MLPTASHSYTLDDLDGSSVRRLKHPSCRPSTLTVSACSALAGAIATAIVMSAAFPATETPGKIGMTQGWSALSAARGLGLTFEASRAEETLGELTVGEVREVSAWAIEHMGAKPSLNASCPTCRWLAGPSAVELFRPPKSATVAYLDGHGPRPQRFARVTLGGPTGVDEYRVGPIKAGKVASEAVAERLTKPGDIPYVKRPTENDEDSSALMSKTIKEIESLVVKAFGHVFPDLPGFTGKDGMAASMLRSDPLEPAGQRINYVVFLWSPPATTSLQAIWLHPMPLRMKQNVTSPNEADWTVIEVAFCGQVFPTAAALREAYAHGKVRICPFKPGGDGSWSVPQHETAASATMQREEHSGVRWGPWSFTVTQRPSTGIALVDVRFRGERVLYELSLQDAQAAYAGDRQTQFFYSDASWSLSMLSTSLEPGVDCPEGAHYIEAATWFNPTPTGDATADPSHAWKFYPACVFEWEEDHTIWRHMVNSDPRNKAPPKVHGLVRKTVVVRSIATVGNYDYIIDVKLREDGEIETHCRFAGYLESRYYDAGFNPAEQNFSTILRPDLAGPVHSHIVNWKADIDIAGVRNNALALTKVKIKSMEAETAVDESRGPLLSKYLERSYVEKEGVDVSTFVSQTQHPGYWALVDRKATSAAGNPRGYAVTLATYATGQVLPPDHPFVKSMAYTKYNLAVTKYHDSEYRVTTPYVSYDTLETTRNAQDLDRFLADGENLLDEDLVAWITAGREHVTRQEDLPLVSNFGVGFSLQPWNFFTQNVAASPPWQA